MASVRFKVELKACAAELRASRQASKSLDLGFEFTDSPLVLGDHGRQLILSESRFDVLRAVHIPCVNSKYDGSFDTSTVLVVHEVCEKLLVVFGVSRRSPDLDSTPI